ncbi:hypothetical protein [Thalassobacillus devorans]|uniref:hypothetical protein n=1 Tax=Thalassobacillus devorans TaxID=279813 RepID=UPI0034E96F6B
MKKQLATIALSGTILTGGMMADIPKAKAAGNGPDYQGTRRSTLPSCIHTRKWWTSWKHKRKNRQIWSSK